MEFNYFYSAASRIIRRMKIHPPTLSPPPVTKPQRILPQLLDGTLMNRQKLLNIVYTQILGLVAQARFARDYENTLSAPFKII